MFKTDKETKACARVLLYVYIILHETLSDCLSIDVADSLVFCYVY